MTKTPAFTKLILSLLVAVVPPAFAAPFTPGNLVVVQASSANNTTATVVEINPALAGQTAGVQTIGVSSAGANAIRFSGSASSTGYVANTNDGALVTFTGVNTTNTSSNVNTLNPRAVVAFDPAGNFTLAATYTGVSGNQTRCATSLNNTTWFIGDQGGVYSNGTSTASPAINIRGVKSFGGTVYGLTASASPAVFTISAPVGGSLISLPGLPAGSGNAQDFYLVASGSNGATYDVLYVVDSSSGGTIFKYSLVGGSWVACGSYLTGFGGFGLAAAANGTGAVLYVTTGGGAATANSVMKLTDTAGHDATINITTGSNVTLYTAPAATIIKGVAFAPVAAASATVSISATDANAAEVGPDAGTFRFTRTGSTTNALDVSYSIAAGAGHASTSDYAEVLSGVAVIPAGESFVDVSVTPINDVLLDGDETVQLTVTDTVDYDLGSPSTATVTIVDDEVAIDLSKYVRVGRFNLPHPSNTTPPPNSILCAEASSVTYNWDTDTLFIVGDGGTSVVQVSKTGVLIDSMTLALGSSPQGTEFYDTEGITYVGGGQFVLGEERYRQVNLFTYVAGGTLQRANVKTVKLGTTIGNVGIEGFCYDPQTSGFILLKEKDPRSIFQTNIDFDAGTATNGSPSTVNSTDLFDPALANLLDFSDIFVLSNLPALNGKPASSHLLVLSQESGQIRHLDRAGNISSSLTIVADPGSPLSVPDMTNEGVAMDRDGVLYVVNENGGGNSDQPQLWVYAPSNATNIPPTEITLTNVVNSLPEDTNTAAGIELADIIVADDGLGTNSLSVTGADASFFEFVGSALFLKAGTTLNATTKPTYDITVNVDDSTVGGTPDASIAYTLTVTPATGGTATLVISEVAAWSSGNAPTLNADWFEVTNIGTTTANITGWKVDDSGPTFATAIALSGVTSIAPGESVIFIETSGAQTVSGNAANFRTLWFGANPPAALQVGSYSGSGIGLGTGGDAVNLFDSNGTIQASVSFGSSTGSAPYKTFDNAAGLDATTISTLSESGVHGAFAAGNDANQIGSPGTIGISSTPVITIVAQDASAAETGTDPATFRISRTGSTTGVLTVNYTIATGAGQATGDDYTPTLSGSALIASGDSFVDVTITPVDDAVAEGNETVTLTLFDTGSYDVGSPGVATVTIVDNDFPNQAPTAVVLGNTVPSLPDNTSTAISVRVADISITDDGMGTNVLSLAGSDADFFEIAGASLYLKAGTALNYLTKPTYNVTVNVDDSTIGSDPDASANFTLTITQFVPPGTIVITEVAPWSSGNSGALNADWFEVTNLGASAVNISGWKMDDNSNSFGNAAPLSGITTIGAGESVIFIETSNVAAVAATFRTLWFGVNPSANMQIGGYSGSGVGLGTSGDAVNLFDSSGNRITGINVGASPAGPFFTFDNTAGAGSSTLPLPTVSTLSVAGVNGAFVAANDANETGSPGTISNTPAASIYQFENATYTVAETVGSVIVNITRTGATPGADVTFTTTDGSAAAGTDFTAPANLIHFNPGQTSVSVAIPVIDLSSTPQGNRSFTLAITAVPAGSSIGAPGSANITITEGAGNLSVPATLAVNPVNTAGLPNSVALIISRGDAAGGAVNVTVTASPPVTVPTGMAKLDNVKDYTLAGDTATVSFANSEVTKTLNIPLRATARFGRFLLTLSAPTGDATLGSVVQTLVEVAKKDTTAPQLNVTFGTPNPEGVATISGTAADSGAISSGLNRVEFVIVNVNGTSAPTNFTLSAGAFSQDFQLQHGANKFTVTAWDNSGKKTSKSATISYTNTAITALAGKTFTGLLVPNTPHVAASNDNSGLLTVTVGALTAVSGKLMVGGVVAAFSGALDNAGDVHFKPASATTFDVIDKKEFDSYLGALTVSIGGGQAIGTLKTAPGGMVLGVATAAQQATTAEPGLLSGTGAQKYSVALPSKVQAGLATNKYPQGDGYASVTVSPNGSVSVSGMLADGVAYSASGKLHVATATTQSVSLHKNLYRNGGSFTMELVFDLSAATNADSDVLGTGALWVRPSQPRARFYKDGWAAGVSVDAIGARYTVPSAGSVLPGLGATSPNAQLQFEDGNLPALAVRDLDITITNGFINKSSDASLKLSMAKGTGVFKGAFTHTDATKPVYQGIILQEGANAKGFGFFLSTPPLSYEGTGQGGGVSLAPHP